MTDYFTALFSAIARAAKVDGKINKTEVNFSYSLLNMLCDGEDDDTISEMTRSAKHGFNESAKSNKSDLYYLNRLFETFDDDDSDDSKITTIRILIDMCTSDGELNDLEYSFLRKAEEIFDLPCIFDELLNYNKSRNSNRYNHKERNNNGNNNQPMTINDACNILGCSTQSSTDEIKACYRKLVSEYHPDKIQGKNLPNGFIEFANERMKEINKAYEILRNIQ